MKISLIVLIVSCCVSGLLSQSAAPSPVDRGRSDSPLIRAIAARDEAQARQLLEKGESPNRIDRLGATPLGEAIASDLPDLAEYLVRRGADVNLDIDNKRTSPLMAASWSCDFQTTQLLLDSGAEVNHRDTERSSALGLAAYNCQDVRIVELLISKGADVNARDESESTPLILAASRGNWLAVGKLLKAGADPRAKDKDGQTAEGSSCDRGAAGYFKACTLLREALTQKKKSGSTTK